MIGTAVAAAGGWLVAAGGPTAPPPPGSRPGVTARSVSPPVPPYLRLGTDPGDLRVTGAGLEIPVVDTVEMLPGCHR